MEVKNDTLVVSAPRGATFEVERVGPAALPDSKRCWQIERQEVDLTGQLGELEESTRRRNREFEAKLKAIEARTESLALNIEREAEEREEGHEIILDKLKERLAGVAALVEEEVERGLPTRFEPEILEQIGRSEGLEVRAKDFVEVTVPETIDDESGAVTRRLRKAHETFDIENAKIAKREQKIAARFTAHATTAAQSFEDEKATRQAKLWLLGEDIEATEAMDERADDYLTDCVVEKMKGMREEVALMGEEREQADYLLLDSLTHAQERLQMCILETFGTSGDCLE